MGVADLEFQDTGAKVRRVFLPFFCVAVAAVAPAQEVLGQADSVQESRPDYSGPVILSRGGAPRVSPSSELLRITPYLQLGAIYDTGLTGLIADQPGALPDDSSFGGHAAFGAVGYHGWRHTVLSLDYRGSYRRYSRRTFYDGLDTSLGLAVSHQATRRISFVLTESAASHRGGFLGLGNYRFYDPSFTAIAENSVFDTRTHIFLSTARMIWEKSERLSFSMGGSGTVLEPRSRALVPVYGAGASGDVAYRLGRHQTIGVAYEFGHYGFRRAFGSADFHGLSLQYSSQLTRRWRLSLAAGGYRVETLRLERVRLDPVIAAIIGQTTGVEAFHRMLYAPRFAASLSRDFRRSSFDISYSRGIAPGNGLYLTSGHESLGLGYGYTGLRRLHFSASAYASRYVSFSQTIGQYRSYHGGLGVSYKLSRPVSLTARIDGRKYNISGTGFGRLYYRASVGLAFSPGEYPLSLW